MSKKTPKVGEVWAVDPQHTSGTHLMAILICEKSRKPDSTKQTYRILFDREDIFGAGDIIESSGDWKPYTRLAKSPRKFFKKLEQGKLN